MGTQVGRVARVSGPLVEVDGLDDVAMSELVGARSGPSYQVRSWRFAERPSLCKPTNTRAALP